VVVEMVLEEILFLLQVLQTLAVAVEEVINVYLLAAAVVLV
jgi:hypothetical protein